MSRLHVKAGVTLEDGTIAVFARGRTNGIQYISGLLLQFRVI